MNWNRWDICAAYWHFSLLDSPIYGEEIWFIQETYYSRLNDMHYKPGLSDSQLSKISTNAKQIYMQLVRKHFNIGG